MLFLGNGFVIVDDKVINIADTKIIYHGGITFVIKESTNESLYLVYPNTNICTHELKTNDLLSKKLIVLLKLWNTKFKLQLAENGCEKELIELWEKDYAKYQFKTLMLEYLEKNDYNAMQIELLRNKTFMKINKLINKLKEAKQNPLKCQECNPLSQLKLDACKPSTIYGAMFIWIPFIQ